MSVARSVAEVLRDHVVLEVEAIDRMYLNVYVPHLQSVGAVVGYLRVHRGQRFASTTAVTPMTEAFVRNIDQFVNDEGVDLVAAALRFADPRVQALLNVLLLFLLVQGTFTNKDLREHLAPLLGKKPSQLTPGRITYDSRRLRLHGLTERIPKTHRYRITPKGLRTAILYTRLYNRSLRTGLAIISPGAANPELPMAKSIRAAEIAVNKWYQYEKLAA